MDFYIQQIREALEHATAGMSAEELDRERGEKWSPAQILEHLSLTYSGTVRGMQKCLKAGKPIATFPTMKQRVRAAVVVGLGHMPEGRQAPAATIPRGLSSNEVLAQIWSNLDAMEDAIEQCERQFGARVKIVDHPILGPLNATGWRKFHWVHARHHARQIEKIKSRT